MTTSVSRNCTICNEPIPLERLEALPNTLFCIKHAPTNNPIGFLVYSHKTAPQLIILPPSTSPETIRQARRAHRRAR